jgi:hypothetical protein
MLSTGVINEPNGHGTPISVVSFARETFLNDSWPCQPLPWQEL